MHTSGSGQRRTDRPQVRDSVGQLLLLNGCSPLEDFGVLALGAEGFHLKLDGTLLHREEESACSLVGLPQTSSSGFDLAHVVRRRLQSH